VARSVARLTGVKSRQRPRGIIRAEAACLRRHATWIAALLTLALVFSQALVAAHACPVADPAAVNTLHGHAAASIPDCSGMPDGGDPNANVCESHCLTGQHAQPADTPYPPLAPLPALTVRTNAPQVTPVHAFTDVHPRAAPPPRLRFSRFLI
jgi:hypothetical protein